ncbi:MAG: PAS domain S-box protein [Methanoregula sp.]
MNGRKPETSNADNKFQKRRPEVPRSVILQYIIVLLSFLLLAAIGVLYINSINQVATETAISSYQQTELEVVRQAARGSEEYIHMQTVVHGRTDIAAVEQEVYKKFIDPIRLLKNGDAWIYAPDHIVFDQSADLPKEYWGKSMAQIFALQQKNGASHYEEMTADVTNAREGVGYYVWLPEKGPEIAAWTPVRVGNNTWTIGLSTPLPEILEASGASSQIAIAKAGILSSILLAFILLCLWVFSDMKRRQANDEMRESRERFHLIFQNANDGIFVHEISPEGPGKFLDVNNQVCRWLGYTHDEMIRMAVTDIDVPEQFEKFPVIIQHLTDGGFAVFETDFLTKDRKRIPVEVSARLFDLHGKQTVLSIIRNITERKAAELALQVVREKYTKAFLSAPDAITISEMDSGRFIEANDTATKIFGYSREELIGKNALELGIWEKPEDRAAFFDQIKEYGRVQQYEVTERRKSGDLFNAMINADTLSMGGQNYLIAIIRDITEKKRTERELRESESRLATAMDIAALADWEFDVQTGIFTFNDRFYALYATTAEREGGYQMPAEVYAREFVHPDEMNMVTDEANRAITTTDPNYQSQLEHRIIRRDGEIRYIVVRIRITKDASGRTVKTHGANQDITERKIAEKHLREQEATLETLLNAPTDIFALLDRDGTILNINESGARQEGGTVEEITGRNIYDILPPALAGTRKEIIKGVFKSGSPAHFEDEHAGRYFYNNIFPVFNAEQKSVERVVVYTSDITDRKKAELQLQRFNIDLEMGIAERTASLHRTTELLQDEVLQHERAEKKIQESLDEKSVLLKEVHHRVKNNLQIIASMLNLQARYITDEKTLQAIKDSQSRVKAMALVHEKLYRSEDISKISLDDYVKFLGNSLFQYYGMRGRGITLRTDIRDITLDINAAIPVGLIINELISNSLKYAFPDGRTGEISITVTRDGKTLTFLFKDNGIGIPADFDWRNAESLGLRLVNSLVDQLDGTIELDRSAGTSFMIVVTETK